MTHPTRWTPPEWPDAPECQECWGHGYKVVPASLIHGVFFSSYSEPCPICGGTGQVPAADAPDRDTIGDEKYHERVDREEEGR